MHNLDGAGPRSRPLPNAEPLVPTKEHEAMRWAHPVSLAVTKGIPVGFFSSAY